MKKGPTVDPGVLAKLEGMGVRLVGWDNSGALNMVLWRRGSLMHRGEMTYEFSTPVGLRLDVCFNTTLADCIFGSGFRAGLKALTPEFERCLRLQEKGAACPTEPKLRRQLKSRMRSQFELEAAARKAGAVRSRKLLIGSGGTWSAGKVSRRLRLSKRAVFARAEDGRLLALCGRKRTDLKFPAFQFAPGGGALISGLDTVLAELRDEPALDAWSKCGFFLSPRDSLNGESPLTLLQKGRVRAVIALARTYAR